MHWIKALFGFLAQQVRRDPILWLALLLAVVSAFFAPFSPSAYLAAIDWKVLALLLALMLVVAGLKKAGVFGWLTHKLLALVHNARSLSMVLIGICFFSSMFITNDVALITFVPLAIMLLLQTQNESLLIPVIVLQTIAANLGSSLTPFGNPQNLYLYSYFSLSTAEFFRIMALPIGLAFVLLAACCFAIKARPLAVTQQEGKIDLRKTALWLLLFVLCLLSVLRVVPHIAALAAVVVLVLIVDRSLLREADYKLLFTFIFFFLFIGNIKAIPAARDLLAGWIAGRELTMGILLSQIISNVPAAMLLSGISSDAAGLLLGVNLGGLGTPIASMASVISYKIYAALPVARQGKYLLIFSILNVSFLAVLWIAALIL